MPQGRKAWEYCSDTGGHFVTTVAVIGLPLLLIIGLAFDFSILNQRSKKLTDAIDNSALAAVMRSDMNQAEKEAYAKQVFAANYTHRDKVRITVTADHDSVEILAKAVIPSMLGGIVNPERFNIQASNRAIQTKTDVVCVLALDPYSEKSIEFSGKARFAAPACSVQTNSSHSGALFSGSDYTPSARSFCSTGGKSGPFSGPVKTYCTKIGDPYASRLMPNAPVGCKPGLVKNNSILHPGNYCNGLKIDGADVQFMPGLYHIWGELLFTSTSVGSGKDVSFLLRGPTGKLKIDNNAHISLKAPSTGDAKGLVFWQSPNDKGVSGVGETYTTLKDATEKSEISASGGVQIIGTAYFPSQELLITSDKPVSTQSPATSFIAYRIHFGGDSIVDVHVDHEKGGIPPMQPRSDEGARLVN